MGQMLAGDGIRWRSHARVEKYSGDQVRFAAGRSGLLVPEGRDLRRWCGDPEDGTTEAHGNLLTTVGLNLMTNLLIGGTTAGSFKNAQAIVGVGTSTTTANIADTALGSDGTANAWYQQADSANPTQSNGVITCVCTVTTGNANFAWNEWCFASTTAGTITGGTTLASVSSGTEVMWNHKIQSLGTKASGSWVLTATLTLA